MSQHLARRLETGEWGEAVPYLADNEALNNAGWTCETPRSASGDADMHLLDWSRVDKASLERVSEFCH